MCLSREIFSPSNAFANHRDTEECFALKFEIRNPKHETNTKSEFSNVQNVTSPEELSGVSVIWILVIRVCFEFRYLDFGFTIDMFLVELIRVHPGTSKDGGG